MKHTPQGVQRDLKLFNPLQAAVQGILQTDFDTRK
jgi:hypothetical protein